MGMGLNLHRNRIPSGVGRKEVLEEKGSGNPVFVSPSITGINADFRLEAMLLGSSCDDVQGLPRQAPPLRRGWGWGWDEQPRFNCSFSTGSLQKRAPPELAFQQPIQGSSVAQRPELVTRSLA